MPRRELPHIAGVGRLNRRTVVRVAKIAQGCWMSGTQRTPAGLPCGMPGIGELIDGAMQQAPQPLRHSITGIGDAAVA